MNFFVVDCGSKKRMMSEVHNITEFTLNSLEINPNSEIANFFIQGNNSVMENGKPVYFMGNGRQMQITQYDGHPHAIVSLVNPDEDFYVNVQEKPFPVALSHLYANAFKKALEIK